MRRNSYARQAILVIAALITATGLTASGASAEATGTITGTLLTAAGAPEPNAHVTIDGPTFTSTTTSSTGQYTATGLAPGNYRVFFQPRSLPGQYAHDKSSYLEATVFAVAADSTTTVDETLLPVGHIAGRFTRADGSGVAFATVNAYPTSSSGTFAFGQTQTDGSYTLAVRPGTYHVAFRLSGGFQQYAYGTTDQLAAAVITVPGPDQTVTVDDTMLATGGVAGRVLTSTGAPLANADISLSSNTNYFSTRTDESGNYRFAQVTTDRYRVSVRSSAGMLMYAPQTQKWSDAQLYPVTAGEETQLDITFLPTGIISGRFTDGGAGVADVQVSINSQHQYASTSTNANGEYTFPAVVGGDYSVRFDKSNPRIQQYAYGKVTQETAGLFTVVPGTTITVNDTRLAAGSLRVTARDGLTGAPVQQFNVDLNGFWSSTDNGTVTIDDIPQGTHRMWITGLGYDYQEREVTITGGQQTSLEVTLAPLGRVPVTVIDAATGDPVPGVCVFLVDPLSPQIPDGCDNTDESGRMTVWERAGRYTMMALPNANGGHGVQWVGPSGGTGDQREAAVITVVAGQASAAPTIRLDRAGSIAGRVTSETGQLPYGEVALLTSSISLGNSGWGTSVHRDGTYRLDGLGPYQWPLFLYGENHAYQWSGGKVNRFEAQKIQVTSGGTATYDHVLKVGDTVLTGTVRDGGGHQMETRLAAYNSVTGDYAGQVDTVGGVFEMRMLVPHQVKLRADLYWYNGVSLQTAGLLSLSAGTNKLNFCVAGPQTMRQCVAMPIRPMPTGPPGGTLPPQRGTPVPTTPGTLPPVRR